MGSKDTTKLNIQEDISVLNDKACEQSKNLALVLEEASKKHNTDVFVVKKPARFDREAKDPEGIRSVLTVSSNRILQSLITPTKRVHFAKLSLNSTQLQLRLSLALFSDKSSQPPTHPPVQNSSEMRLKC